MNIDLIVLVVIALIFIGLTIRLGKAYITAFILSFYPAYFLFDLAKDTYLESKEPMVVIGLFIICFALMLYILRKTVGQGFSFGPVKIWVDAVVLTLGAIAQVAFVYYHAVPQLSTLYTVSPVLTTFFNGTVPYAILALVPFVALLISARD